MTMAFRVCCPFEVGRGVRGVGPLKEGLLPFLLLLLLLRLLQDKGLGFSCSRQRPATCCCVSDPYTASATQLPQPLLRVETSLLDLAVGLIAATTSNSVASGGWQYLQQPHFFPELRLKARRELRQNLAVLQRNLDCWGCGLEVSLLVRKIFWLGNKCLFFVD